MYTGKENGWRILYGILAPLATFRVAVSPTNGPIVLGVGCVDGQNRRSIEAKPQRARTNGRVSAAP